MNPRDIAKLTQLKNHGWKFTHLSGQRMAASNNANSFIVDATTSASGYKQLFSLIEKV